jgi:hypothetical protein
VSTAAVPDGDAVRGLGDPGDGRSVRRPPAQGGLEGVGDAIHASDRLVHEHGLVPVGLELEVAAEPAGQQVGQPRRRDGRAELEPGAGLVVGGVAVAPAEVAQLAGLGREHRTQAAQQLDQRFLVVGGQVGVERALVDRLGQQLGDVAEGVGFGVAVAHRLPGQSTADGVGGLVVVPALGVGTGEHLDGDVELTAVVERRVVLGMRAGPMLRYWLSENRHVWVTPSRSVSVVPRRTVQLRPPGRSRASSTSTS